jgi:hypothetical protein
VQHEAVGRDRALEHDAVRTLPWRSFRPRWSHQPRSALAGQQQIGGEVPLVVLKALALAILKERIGLGD